MPKYSHCPSCGRCWHCVKPHVVMLDEKRGEGVLCRACWDTIEPAARVRFHFEHWQQSCSVWAWLLSLLDYPVKEWERIQHAVLNSYVPKRWCQTCGEWRDGARATCQVCERALMERRAL